MNFLFFVFIGVSCFWQVSRGASMASKIPSFDETAKAPSATEAQKTRGPPPTEAVASQKTRRARQTAAVTTTKNLPTTRKRTTTRAATTQKKRLSTIKPRVRTTTTARRMTFARTTKPKPVKVRTTTTPAPTTKMAKKTIQSLVATENVALQTADLPPESEMPTVFVADILAKCSDIVSPTVRAPLTIDNSPTSVFTLFDIDQFIGIDNVDEVIEVTGTLSIRWSALCQQPSLVATPERVAVRKLDDVWHPGVIFRSGVDDVGMIDTTYYNDVEIIAKTSNGNVFPLLFYWSKIGIFKSKCRLDLRKFPFDTQVCRFVFTLKQTKQFLLFSEDSTAAGPTMSPNDEWEVIGRNVTVSDYGNSSQVAFSLTLKRKPQFLTINVLGPCLFLMLLALAAFMLNPEMAARPAYFCLIFFALIVAQSGALNVIPQTPQRVLLTDYILALTVIIGTCTSYSLVTCYYANANPEKANKIIQRCKAMSFIRLIDSLFFAAAISVFIAINVYAALITTN